MKSKPRSESKTKRTAPPGDAAAPRNGGQPAPARRPPASEALDPRSLKALAHPLRLRLLGLLREYGPATATELARRVGESSGSTSYHLRQLARYGFVADAPDRSTRRERAWRAAAAATSFDEEALAREPGGAAVTAEFLRAVAAGQAERTARWIDAVPGAEPAWRGAGTVSDWGLSLRRDELDRLQAEVEELIARYRAHDPERAAPADERFVAAQVQFLPRLGGSEKRD